MSFYLKTTLAVVAVVATAVALIVWLTGSDARAIERLLDDGVAAANRFDADALVALVSKNYSRRTEDYAAITERIRAVAKERPYTKAELTGSEITVTGDTAVAEINVSFHTQGTKIPQGFTVKLAREGEVWRVTSFETRDLVR